MQKVDLIICRDVLTRSSQKNNILILKNFVRSKSKYLLTTFYPETKKNSEIMSGEFSKINLLISPYSLNKPITYFKEKGKWNKYMGIHRCKRSSSTYIHTYIYIYNIYIYILCIYIYIYSL